MLKTKPLSTSDGPAISSDPEICTGFHADRGKVAAVQRALLRPDSIGALAETFKVLGDPTRVRILDALSKAELCVCDIATLLTLTESAVSHQLRILRNVRLVRSRRDGRMVFYALDDQHIISLFEQGLRHVEELWVRKPADRDDSDRGAA